MGRRSGFSFLGLFKLKRSKREQQRRAAEEEFYEREGVSSVTKAYYKVWPSDEDRLNWVADPQIDAKATAFLDSKRRQFRGRDADDA